MKSALDIEEVMAKTCSCNINQSRLAACPEYSPSMDDKWCLSCLHEKKCHFTPNAKPVHSCSQYCEKPECVHRQRDQFRDYIQDHYGTDGLVKALCYRPAQS